MMNIEAEVARRLLEIKAIKLSPNDPFTWASGIKSPIYCDNRKSLSYPEVRKFIKKCLVEKSKEFGTFDTVSGVATAGIPQGALLADALEQPFIYVRSKAKGHGLQNMIEGEAKEGAAVLVVEDLISTGGSSIKAVNALRDAGLKVVGVIAIFTYGFAKATENFANADCQLLTLSNFDALLDEAVSGEFITEAEMETVNTWRREFL
ncbi:MAG: orotate phosphoribosyltransferase [Bacteroidota bacterium]